MLTYMGDCINILQEETLFSDATEMAQVVGGGLPCELFPCDPYWHDLVTSNPENWEVYCNSECLWYHNMTLYWLYNIQEDIHYFFV